MTRSCSRSATRSALASSTSLRDRTSLDSAAASATCSLAHADAAVRDWPVLTRAGIAPSQTDATATRSLPSRRHNRSSQIAIWEQKSAGSATTRPLVSTSDTLAARLAASTASPESSNAPSPKISVPLERPGVSRPGRDQRPRTASCSCGLIKQQPSTLRQRRLPLLDGVATEIA
jgi:hypothetical protein